MPVVHSGAKIKSGDSPLFTKIPKSELCFVLILVLVGLIVCIALAVTAVAVAIEIIVKEIVVATAKAAILAKEHIFQL